MRVLSASDDHSTYVLASILAPVPHEEWMSAVVSIATPIHFNVARIVGKLLFVLLAQHKSVACFRQQAIEKLDVARVKAMIKFVVARVVQDQHAALLEQRLVAIEIEVIAKPHYLHQQWIQN